MTACQFNIAKYLYRAKCGGGSADVFDLMYEFSKPYGEIKSDLDCLIAEGKAVQLDLRTYALADGAEDMAEYSAEMKAALSRLAATLKTVSDGRKKSSEDEAAEDGRKSPLERRFAALERWRKQYEEKRRAEQEEEATEEGRRAKLKEERDEAEREDDIARILAEARAEQEEEESKREREEEEEALASLFDTDEDDDFDDYDDEDLDEVDLDDDEDEEEEDGDGAGQIFERYNLPVHSENFDEVACKVIDRAFAIAKQYDCVYIGTEHILLSLLQVELDGFEPKILLEKHGVNGENFANSLSDFIRPDFRVAGFTFRARSALHRAEWLQHGRGKLVGCGHILKAIAEDDECTASRILLYLGVNLGKLVRDALKAVSD